MPELVFFRRGEEVLRFTLERPRTVVGRGDKSDVVLPDPAVSRSHAALRWDGEKMTLEDLSGKGTLVAGAPTQQAVLPDGADIAFGPWRAIYRERTSPESDLSTAGTSGTTTEMQPRDAAQARWQPAQIRVRHGQTETLEKVSSETMMVGSDEGNQLVLKHRFISGRHLKLIRKDGLFRVVDLESTNGTYVGNVRVHDVEVPLFTSVRLGDTELVLEPLSVSRKEQSFHGIIGSAPSVRQLAELIERVAPSSATVAIFGESGTGKELVAHAVHQRSTRADQAFIPVNCAAISKELIESELFGHEKGAFTGALAARRGAFEEADGGTLFLDEFGELPLDLQAKLLRALESGEIKRVGAARPGTVDVRVVAATNRDLLALGREGKFREDLYYRLCVIPLHLPPLRSRKGDLVSLAEHFIRAFSPRGQNVRLTQSAVERLQAHRWPGNIRELRNVVHRALLLRKGPMIDAPDLSFDQEVNADTGLVVPEVPPGMTLEQMLEKVERQIVENALRRWNNNRERVAKELGVARSTLFKRLKDWGLTNKEEEPE